MTHPGTSVSTSGAQPVRRIALGAQSFGFGPASKAVSIATRLREDFPTVELVCCADRVSREYLTREGVWRDGRDIATDDGIEADALAARLGPVDAAVVVLDPELASFFQARVPTYFVDSLGFMWGQAFFDQFPAVREVTRYFVQDAFGAAGRLGELGIRNVHPVGAIIEPRTSPCHHSPDLVVNLGGLLNIFSEGPVRRYVDGVMGIVRRMGAGRDTLILTSQRARDTFDALAASPFPVTSLPHGQALWAFSQARTVLTSPGLTTLLELVQSRIPAVPLPPQNMSQALIIAHVAERIGGSPGIWDFLAANYPLSPGMDEEAGVAMVQDRNARLLFDAGFVKDYLGVAAAAERLGRALPSTLVPSMDGAATICAAIMRDLEKGAP